MGVWHNTSQWLTPVDVYLLVQLHRVRIRQVPILFNAVDNKSRDYTANKTDLEPIPCVCEDPPFSHIQY